jgi:hypothetical protein
MERISDIVDATSFERDDHQWIVKQAVKYYMEYKELPTAEVFKITMDKLIDDESVKKTIGDQLRIIFQKITDSDIKFIKEQFLEFCKNQKLKNAIWESSDLLEGCHYDKIKVLIDNAMKAGMERNIGHNYMTDVETRMSVMARNTVRTNWQVIDTIMDGGLAPGELGIVTACAGAGKSWVLARLGAEAMKQGKNVLHFTLELNENYVGLRYDACFTGIDFQNIRNNITLVKDAISKVPGKLIIKYFPLKTVSAHSLKVHTERIQTLGTKIDLIIVDYADILRPFTSDKNANSYSEAGGIYEELRSISGELQIPIWSASQSNRAGMEEDILTAFNISDSYRKIMTADFIMSVSRKTQDKLSHTARYHIIKNRFGPDGMTFPARMNTGCGNIQLFDENSHDGVKLAGEMAQGENAMNKQFLKKSANKWKQYMGDDDNGDV